MSLRNTTTGAVMEAMIRPALERGGYSCRQQTVIGTRVGGRVHKIDANAEKDGQSALVSLKWQQTGGTAEQKVPFEVICLLDAIQQASYSKAYLVLGGEGWTLREFYVGGGLDRFVREADRVEILTLEGFVARANQSKL